MPILLFPMIFAGAAKAEDAVGSYQSGVAAFEQGNYDTAIEILLPLAEQGDAAAQTLLARVYLVKPGYNDDVRQAEKWLLRAAKQGVVEAQFGLGHIYSRNLTYDEFGRIGDFSEVEKWYRLAAERDFAPAQAALAELLMRAGKERKAEGFQWLLKAANQGFVNVFPLVSDAYLRGQGVEANLIEAVRWARLAADNGHVGGYWSLARMYKEGLGVPQDNVQVYMWYDVIVQTIGDKPAAIYRDTVASKMTQDQIAEAQRLVGEWIATHRP